MTMMENVPIRQVHFTSIFGNKGSKSKQTWWDIYFFLFYFIFKLYITVLVLPNNWPAGISRRLQNSKNLQCKFHCQRLFKKIKGKDFVVVLVAKSCPTLWDPMDCSPPGSSVYGIFQARILEWVAFSSSKGSFLPRYQTWVSCIGRGFFTTEPPGKPEDKGI